MNKTQRDNMLLFSKEKTTGVNRYRLYFTTLSTLDDDTPRVFRLLVRTPFTFNKFEMGRVYTLTYRKTHIRKFGPKEEFNLQEAHFTKLLRTRDLKFMDKKTSAALRAMDKPHFSKDRYYSFEETKEIVNYKMDFLSRVASATVSAVMTGFAFLLPFAIYAYMLYLLIRGQMDIDGYSSRALVLPIMGIGALPMTVYVMSVLFMLSELALLRIDFTKYSVLKKYTLAWGGMRKSIFFEISDIRYLRKFGIVSAAVLIVSIIFSVLI